MELPTEVLAALRRLDLVNEAECPPVERLAGGVSSDIWLVRARARAFCVKRALPRLRVAQEWLAPVERNAHEVDWLRTANTAVPGVAPEVLAHDHDLGMFAMPYLPPDAYPLWKSQLLNGEVDLSSVRAVADRMARIHAATAGNTAVARRFATDAIFHDIRLAPYLEATGRRHPDLAEPLHSLAMVTASNHRALVHGDISPKNILIGAHGPIFLDAECAWYGDPAFDIAFCLNHLMLKCLARPAAAATFLTGFDVLAERYLTGVTWEPPAALESRAARLLPGLFLARIDGKSPVDYVGADDDKARVRRVARALLARPVGALLEVRRAWARELGL